MKQILALWACLTWAMAAWAQAPYPSKPVKVIVPFPVGQATDVLARILTQEFTDAMGQSFYVENKAGAAAIVGMEAAKAAAPDGYTLLMASSGPLTINAALYAKLNYDTLRDFEPIGMAVIVPQFLVVNKDFPANNLKELMAYVKQNPGKLNYGSGGTGLTNHLTMEMLKSQTGMQITHVPYKGAAAALTALISGEISMMFESSTPVIPHAKTGRIKVIAVGSKKRSVAMPDVPTVAEAGVPGFAAQTWAAWLAPAHTPRPIILKMNAELLAALQKPAIAERMLSLGAEPFESTPEQAVAYIKSELVNWAAVAKASGTKAD